MPDWQQAAAAKLSPSAAVGAIKVEETRRRNSASIGAFILNP